MDMDIFEINLQPLTGKNLDDLTKSHPYEVYHLITNLMMKQFTISDSAVEHRSVLHWERKGIIDITHSQDGAWRRFSFFDYVWLQIIKELRSFGVSVKAVKKLREELFASAEAGYFTLINSPQFADVKEQLTNIIPDAAHVFDNPPMDDPTLIDDNPLTWFHLLVLQLVYKRDPSYLLFFDEGSYTISFLTEPNFDKHVESLLSSIENTTTLVIPLTRIIDRFFSSEKFSGNTYFNLSPLSRQEKEIIDIIRSGDVKNVNIEMKEGKKFYLEILRKKPTADSLDEIKRIIAKKKYHRITLETEIGNVSYINEIEKKIIK